MWCPASSNSQANYGGMAWIHANSRAGSGRHFGHLGGRHRRRRTGAAGPDVQRPSGGGRADESNDPLRLVPRPGYRIEPSFAITKIVWLHRHEEVVFAATARFLHQSDYIIGQLTGNFAVTEYSNAVKTDTTWCATPGPIGCAIYQVLPNDYRLSSRRAASWGGFLCELPR